MFDDGILRAFSVGLFDFAASFPVIYAERSVVLVSEYHINRARNPQFFVKYGPLGSVCLQVRIVFYKLLEILVLDVWVIARALVIEALDVVVHGGSGCGGFVAILVPLRLNLVGCLSIVFAFSPFFGAHH